MRIQNRGRRFRVLDMNGHDVGSTASAYLQNVDVVPPRNLWNVKPTSARLVRHQFVRRRIRREKSELRGDRRGNSSHDNNILLLLLLIT